jgi:outer membrane protein assembly factor BamB
VDLHLQSGDFEVLLSRVKFWLLPWLIWSLALTSRAQTEMTNLWSYRLPDEGTKSSPALAPDGTILQATFYGWLLALTPEGKLKWKFKAGREIHSSPAVAADGTIYFGSRDRKYYALTAAGKLKWIFATGAWVDSSAALATDGSIYFGSHDKYFYALNPNGSLKWKFATSNIVSGSPAIAADGAIYFGSHDKYFYALTPGGKLKWKFATGAEITASPAVAADGTIYFSSTDGNFYALNPDGTERWRLHTGGSTASSPVLDEAGNIYFAVNRERYAVAADGKILWHFLGNSLADNASAVMADGNLFTIGYGTQSGLMNAAGNFLWNFSMGASFHGSPNVSPSGIIYVADELYLHALRPQTNAVPAAKSAWPLWRGNSQHTGRAGK